MVGVMIFVIKNKQMVQLGLDLLNFVPSKWVSLFKCSDMKRSLCFAKFLKQRAQGIWKSVASEPTVKQEL